MRSGHIFEENEAFNWSQKCRFLRVNFCSSQREIEEIQASQNATKLEPTDNAMSNEVGKLKCYRLFEPV
jgi:hypothetical protein